MNISNPILTIAHNRLDFMINGKTIAAYLKEQQCYGCDQSVAGIVGKEKEAFAATGLCVYCLEHIIRELGLE